MIKVHYLENIAIVKVRYQGPDLMEFLVNGMNILRRLRDDQEFVKQISTQLQKECPTVFKMFDR